MATIQIKYCDIPAYLHAGEFYRNLDNEDQEGIIEIPLDCFHPQGDIVEDLDEFQQLLRVMMFWMLDEIPQGILFYCNEHDVQTWGNRFFDEAAQVEVQPFLLTAFSDQNIISLGGIVATGRWDIITHAVNRIDRNDTGATAIAAYFGNLKLLTHLHNEGFAWDEKTCSAACENGHLDCLQFLHENGCPWDQHTPNAAAKAGSVATLRYAMECSCPYNEMLLQYATCTSECLKYLVDDFILQMDEEVFKMALLGGNLGCLQYLIDQGCPLLDAQFVMEDEENYDLFYREDNPEFLACIQYAVGRGWMPDEDSIRYLASKDTLCSEWFTLEGFINIPAATLMVS